MIGPATVAALLACAAPQTGADPERAVLIVLAPRGLEAEAPTSLLLETAARAFGEVQVSLRSPEQEGIDPAAVRACRTEVLLGCTLDVVRARREAPPRLVLLLSAIRFEPGKDRLSLAVLDVKHAGSATTAVSSAEWEDQLYRRSPRLEPQLVAPERDALEAYWRALIAGPLAPILARARATPKPALVAAAPEDAPSWRTERTIVIWSGAAVALAGTVALGFAAAETSGIRAGCLERPGDEGCGGPARFAFDAGAAPIAGRDGIDGGSIPAVPLALGLTTTGLTWALATILTGEASDPPWLPLAAGLIVGAATFTAVELW